MSFYTWYYFIGERWYCWKWHGQHFHCIRICVQWYIFHDPFIAKQSSCTINFFSLTHWGRVTHICVVKLIIIGSDNGLSPGRRQAIIWTNTGILLIGPLGTNLSEILIEILTFSFKKMRLKLSSAKWRLFGLGLNELMCYIHVTLTHVMQVTVNSLVWHKCRYIGT